MSPEIAGQLRTLLAALAGVFVAKGWLDSSLVEPIIGLVGLSAAAYWSYRAKQPDTVEAQKVAEKVVPPAPSERIQTPGTYKEGAYPPAPREARPQDELMDETPPRRPEYTNRRPDYGGSPGSEESLRAAKPPDKP